jgi:hypothetical protein
MTLGAALTKRRRRPKQLKKGGGSPTIHGIAGEIALMVPEPDGKKAEGYFERAPAVAREQQAKSWELRAAIAWPGYDAIRVNDSRGTSFSPRSIVGSLRASIGSRRPKSRWRRSKHQRDPDMAAVDRT